MAFPSVISSTADPYHGVGGPYLASNGYVYLVMRGVFNEVQVFRATDPSSSWTGLTALVVTSTNTIRAINACQVGDVMHIVTRDASAANSNQIRYHAFNMASETFTTSNELVKNTYTLAAAVDETMVGIIIRSDGDKIVLYEGPQVLADIQRSRTYYARHLGAAWSADIALDNGGNVHWYPQEMIRGSSDRIHFFLLDVTNDDLYQRTLTSADVLETFPAAFDTTLAAQGDTACMRGVAYSASASGTVVRLPYFNTFYTNSDVRFTSVDAPSGLTVTFDPTNPVGGSYGRHSICHAADGNVVHSIFASSTDGDIYIQSSQDAGSWSSPVSFMAGDFAYLFPNVYTRNSAKVIGLIHLNNGTGISYTEYTLSTTAVVGSMYLRSLLGSGR